MLWHQGTWGIWWHFSTFQLLSEVSYYTRLGARPTALTWNTSEPSPCNWTLVLSHPLFPNTSPAMLELRSILRSSCNAPWPRKASSLIFFAIQLSFKQQFAPILQNLWLEISLPGTQWCYFCTLKGRYWHLPINGSKDSTSSKMCESVTGSTCRRLLLSFPVSCYKLTPTSLYSPSFS